MKRCIWLFLIASTGYSEICAQLMDRGYPEAKKNNSGMVYLRLDSSTQWAGVWGSNMVVPEMSSFRIGYRNKYHHFGYDFSAGILSGQDTYPIVNASLLYYPFHIQSHYFYIGLGGNAVFVNDYLMEGWAFIDVPLGYEYSDHSSRSLKYFVQLNLPVKFNRFIDENNKPFFYPSVSVGIGF